MGDKNAPSSHPPLSLLYLSLFVILLVLQISTQHYFYPFISSVSLFFSFFLSFSHLSTSASLLFNSTIYIFFSLSSSSLHRLSLTASIFSPTNSPSTPQPFSLHPFSLPRSTISSSLISITSPASTSSSNSFSSFPHSLLLLPVLLLYRHVSPSPPPYLLRLPGTPTGLLFLPLPALPS